MPNPVFFPSTQSLDAEREDQSKRAILFTFRQLISPRGKRRSWSITRSLLPLLWKAWKCQIVKHWKQTHTILIYPAWPFGCRETEVSWTFFLFLKRKKNEADIWQQYGTNIITFSWTDVTFTKVWSIAWKPQQAPQWSTHHFLTISCHWWPSKTISQQSVYKKEWTVLNFIGHTTDCSSLIFSPFRKKNITTMTKSYTEEQSTK